MKTKHLDIGCGINPRNPFSRDMLYGIDIINVDNSEVDFEYIKSDVVLEKLPFEDSFFDSISCYDFLEHIPRTIHRNSKLEYHNKFSTIKYFDHYRKLYSKVNILSLPYKKIGSKIKPGSFSLTQEGITIKDDGKGNLFDTTADQFTAKAIF